MNIPTTPINAAPPAERDLELALAKQLERILGEVPWLRSSKVEHLGGRPDSGWDLVVPIPLPNGNAVRLLVECKAEPRPSLFSTIVERKFRHGGRVETDIPLLAAPFIGERMAEVCWDKNWSWYDLAGNCRINVPDVLYIERTGQSRSVAAPRPSVNLSRLESARILRVLLAPDNAGKAWKTQRDLLLHFGQEQLPWLPRVSLGLINKVIQSLREDGYLRELDHRGFKVTDPLGLLDAWRKAYRFEKHRRQGYFTFLQGQRLAEALTRFESYTAGHAAYAVFSAAERQAPAVRQPKTWLYIAPELEERFRTEVEAKPVESGENLVVLFPADNHVFYLEEGEGLPSTNPVQTYVDLCSVGSRGEEAAQAILNQSLKPVWHHYGLI